MTLAVTDRVTTLDLGLTSISAEITTRARPRARSVVVNLDDAPAVVAAEVPGHLPARQSAVLGGTDDGPTVDGALLLVLTAEPDVDEQTARAAGWVDYYEGRPSLPVLLRGPQRVVGTVDLDATAASTGRAGTPAPHEVRVNLWFSPAGTSCGRHRVHPFLEFHTQVAGLGAMEKFAGADAAAAYEEQLLAPGSSGAAAFSAFDPTTRTYTYPWHQYRALTDALWLAVEYHLIQPHHVREDA